MEHRAPLVPTSSMKRASSSPAVGRKSQTVMSPGTRRRRIAGIPTPSRSGIKRGHSDMGLSFSSSRSSLSHLPINMSSKKLRRCISWDVRPPKIHEPNESRGDKPDEKNDAWYSREEYKTFVAEQYWTVHIMQYLRATGSDESELDPEKYCERGLESYLSKEQRTEIDMKRKLHKLLVIHEQARQSALGTKDPEQIRLMATSQSEASLLRAQIRAALDQHEVQRALSNNGTEKVLSPKAVVVAGVEDRNYVVPQTGLLEEQHRPITGQRHSPCPPQDDMENDDTPELTIAGTVPFASLFSERSIFNKGVQATNPSSVAPIRQSLTHQRNWGHGDFPLRRLSPKLTATPPAAADEGRTVHSVTDFLRRARMVRQEELSGRTRHYPQPGMNDQKPMPLVSFGGNCNDVATCFRGNDVPSHLPSLPSNSKPPDKNTWALGATSPPRTVDSAIYNPFQTTRNTLSSMPPPCLAQDLISSYSMPSETGRSSFLATALKLQNQMQSESHRGK